MSRIPTGKARGLAKKFKLNKLGKKLKDKDTQGVWYDKQDFYDALGLVKDGQTGFLKEAGIEQNGVTVFPDGIRLYFGAYSEDHENPVKKGKLTVILVSTREESPQTGIIKKHLDILTSPAEGPEELLKEFSEFNDGQLCPPPNCDPNGLLNF